MLKDHSAVWSRPRTRVLHSRLTPTNPTGASLHRLSARVAADITEEHVLHFIARSEIYGELGFNSTFPLLGTLIAIWVVSLSDLSKAYFAPGWQTLGSAERATQRLNDAVAAMKN